MQSGISASQELHDAFNNLVSDSSQFGLLATIQKESLVPVTTLPSSSSEFSSNLSSLSSHLEPNVALYIILRRFPTDDGYLAITYVPDSAPVRQNMLFASTRLTLVRELGIERFRETIFATTPQELTASGFEMHDAYTKLDAPLTEEERTLGEVKRKEQEEGLGLSARKSHVKSGVSFNVQPEAMEALKSLAGEGDENLVQLKIDTKNELITLVSLTSATASSISTAISATEPRYSFFKYTHTHQGTTSSPIVFIYTCPSTSKVQERMQYALSRQGIVSVAETDAGLTVERKLEVTGPEDITEQGLSEEFHPKTETKKAFERPKRPGRR